MALKTPFTNVPSFLFQCGSKTAMWFCNGVSKVAFEIMQTRKLAAGSGVPQLQ
jgi:hypothetical protein